MKNDELVMQAACFEWFHNTFHSERKMLHANNNNSVNRIAGNKAKSLGVMPGVSDLEWLRPNGKMLWMEAKTDKGEQSEHQKEFQRKVEERGGEYIIFRSLEEFKNIVNRNL